MTYYHTHPNNSTLQREIETAETVAGERVGAALENDGFGLVTLHDLSDHLVWREEGKRTGLKIDTNEASSMPAKSGKFRE